MYKGYTLIAIAVVALLAATVHAQNTEFILLRDMLHSNSAGPMTDNVKLTAAEAAASGWTVAQTCVPTVGRIGTLDDSPGYPLRTHYDADGNLIGLTLGSPGPIGWPGKFCPPPGIPNVCTPFGMNPGRPEWHVSIWFRDVANMCSPGAGGGLVIDKLAVGTFGDELLHGLDVVQLENAEESPWFYTITCVPRMGVHMVQIPTRPPPPPNTIDSPRGAPAALVVLADLDLNLIGFELVASYNFFAPPGALPDPPMPPWEVDPWRPDKPFDSFSWHFWWIPQDPSSGNAATLPSGPQTIKTQCIAGLPPGAGQPFDSRWRSYDGANNFQAQDQSALRGSSFQPYARLFVPPWYAGDGFTGDVRTVGKDGEWPLPSGRLVSNLIFDVERQLATNKVNDLQLFWGMLMTVDLCLTARSNLEPISIDVPECDEFMDPGCTGTAKINAVRAPAVPAPWRTAINEQTSYLDASWLYGAYGGANYILREFEGGRLSESWFPGSTIGIVPVFPNGYVRAGDLRVNKSPPLQSLHVVFYREHNRKADELAALYPDWDDETVFQHARIWTIALVQSYSTREYLGALLGEPLPPYEGYKPEVDASITSEFCHMAFRYAHAKLNSIYERVDPRFEQDSHGHVLMRDNHWHRRAFNQTGPEPLLRGLTAQQAGETRAQSIDDVRNFYAQGTLEGADLFALNIMRGREVGLGGYNDYRRLIRDRWGADVQPLASWSELTSDGALADRLASLYGPAPGGLENLDAYVGALIEPHIEQTSLGPVMWYIVRQQLLALRNGDRFWYESIETVPVGVLWGQENVTAIYDRKLEDVIEDNTDMKTGSMGSGIFFLQSRRLETLFADGEVGFFTFDDATDGEFSDEASQQLAQNYKIWWTMNSARTTIRFQLQIYSLGWVGLGFEPQPNTMKGADIYFCRVWSNNGTVEVRDSFALDVGPPRLDQDVPCDLDFDGDGEAEGCGESSIRDVSGFEDSVRTVIFFERDLSNDDPWDKDIPFNEEIKVIFAFNPTTDELRYHGPTRSADTFINFYRGPYRVRDVDEVSTAILVIVGLLGGIGVLLALLFLVLLAVKTDHFRFASPAFCALVLCGAVVCYSAIFTLLEDPPSDASCTVFIWLAGVGFVFMFSCLFAKTFRIWRLMSSQSLKAQLITNTQLLIWVGALTFGMIVYLAIWTGVDRPKSEFEVTDYDDDKAHYQCETNIAWLAIWIAIFGLFIVVGVVLSVLTRNLPEEFNDAKPIAWSMYNMLLIYGGAVGLGFALEQWQSARVLIQAFAIFLIITFTIVALFGPLTWRMLIQRKGPKTFRSTMASSGGSSGMSGLSSTSG
jgi:Animal haem peroxidase/7 transmembrane sweet-taste receptor of 3 GCPR/DOMON domain